MCSDRACDCLANENIAEDAHDDKIRELEERIRQLEARPYPIAQPYPVPTWPGGNAPVWTWPASPTYPPWPFAPYTTWC